MKNLYKYWHFRIMYSIVFGYACFYLVRANLSMTTLSMIDAGILTKENLGVIFTTFALIYGLGKGIAGWVSDRANPRIMMPLGLLFAGVANFMVGMGSSFYWLLFAWSLNACFQSLGSPSCIKILTHWFDKREIGTRWAVWNSAQQIGSAIPAAGAGLVIASLGWRAMFFIPAVFCLFASFILFNRLRASPESVGLPGIRGHHANGTAESSITTQDADNNLTFSQILWECVFKNRLVWLIGIANFFLYMVRFGLISWAPTLLMEHRNNTIVQAGIQTVLFDLASVTGGILAGYLSDKVFKGNRGIVSVLFLLALMSIIVLLMFAPPGLVWVDCVLMALIGFFISGPQILAGVAAADFASKRVAGTANGLIGIFGYCGASIAGFGVAKMSDSLGWNATLLGFAGAAAVSAFFFGMTFAVMDKQKKVSTPVVAEALT
jgi:sugar phosphate permease